MTNYDAISLSETVPQLTRGAWFWNAIPELCFVIVQLLRGIFNTLFASMSMRQSSWLCRHKLIGDLVTGVPRRYVSDVNSMLQIKMSIQFHYTSDYQNNDVLERCQDVRNIYIWKSVLTWNRWYDKKFLTEEMFLGISLSINLLYHDYMKPQYQAFFCAKKLRIVDIMVHYSAMNFISLCFYTSMSVANEINHQKCFHAYKMHIRLIGCMTKSLVEFALTMVMYIRVAALGSTWFKGWVLAG